MNYSEDQLEALNKLNYFIHVSDEQLFLLKGKPGVGKTTIMKEFINRLKKSNFKDFIICAPTHKAAGVLADGIDENVITIHKFLELSPIVDVLEFDLKDLRFSLDGNNIKQRLVIIDESSMINDHLYDAIMNRITKRSKIIFIADFKQLRPVKAKNLSKVSSITNSFELTTNHRQDDNSIITLCEDSRNTIITDFSKYNSDNIKLYNSAKKMTESAIENFKLQSNLEYVKLCKILTYTNSRVESFNQYIHNVISNNDEYYYNELLTGYTAYKDIISNSEDFVVKNHKNFSVFYKDFNLKLEGYLLTIKSLIKDNEYEIFILKRDTSLEIKNIIGEKLEEIRMNAINSYGKKRNSYWTKWYELNDAFCTPFDIEYEGRIVKKKTLDYGYAITIHRSQGSTYDLVYYDNNSIQFCYNDQEKRQLQHVALSRVREQLNILV